MGANILHKPMKLFNALNIHWFCVIFAIQNDFQFILTNALFYEHINLTVPFAMASWKPDVMQHLSIWRKLLLDLGNEDFKLS